MPYISMLMHALIDEHPLGIVLGNLQCLLVDSPHPCCMCAAAELTKLNTIKKSSVRRALHHVLSSCSC